MRLSDYIDVLEKIKLLSPEQEACLWHEYKHRDSMVARNTLIEQYQPLVYKEARKYECEEIDSMDLIQEGLLGLIESVERYDAEKGVIFAHYSRIYIRGRILDFLRREGKKDVLLSVSQEHWWEEVPDEMPLTEERIEEKWRANSLRSQIQQLAEPERHVVMETCFTGTTVKRVAEELATSESYIYRLRRRAFCQLKKIFERE